MWQGNDRISGGGGVSTLSQPAGTEPETERLCANHSSHGGGQSSFHADSPSLYSCSVSFWVDYLCRKFLLGKLSLLSIYLPQPFVAFSINSTHWFVSLSYTKGCIFNPLCSMAVFTMSCRLSQSTSARTYSSSSLRCRQYPFKFDSLTMYFSFML